MGTDWSAVLGEVEKTRLPSLEEVLTSDEYFGLTTATPLQRAICRVAEGRPLGELKNHPHVLAAIGDTSHLKGKRPKEFMICAGIRCGKSLLNAALMAHAALTADLSSLRFGEVPRIAIVSVDRRSAQVTLDHFVAGFMRSKKLSPYLTQGSNNAWYVTQPHTGRKIEVSVVANRRDGASLVSAWLVGVIFDEAARMAGSDEGVINLNDARGAVLFRILEGGQITYCSSPTAPDGFFYEQVTKYFQHPSPECVVAKCQSPWLNPAWWTEERVETNKKHDPDVYLTDVLAEFASTSDTFIPEIALARATQPPHTYDPRLSYVAAIDPATRGNGFTLIVATRSGDARIVAEAREWKGTKESPLNTLETIYEVAQICAKYNVRVVQTDQYMADNFMERGRECGIIVTQSKLTLEQKSKYYKAVQQKFLAGQIQIPANPTLRADLQRAKKVVMASGGWRLELPFTKGDGRHCDFVPSFMLALGGFCADAGTDAKDENVSPEVRLAAKLKEEAFEAVRRKQLKVSRENRIRNVLVPRLRR